MTQKSLKTLFGIELTGTTNPLKVQLDILLGNFKNLMHFSK